MNIANIIANANADLASGLISWELHTKLMCYCDPDYGYDHELGSYY